MASVMASTSQMTQRVVCSMRTPAILLGLHRWTEAFASSPFSKDVGTAVISWPAVEAPPGRSV